MFKKPNIILPIIITFAIGLVAPIANTFARDPDPSSDVCSLDVPESVRDATGCNSNSDQLPQVIVNILNVVIGLSGLIAVIFIIIGGINYMTSAGETAKLEKAKKTILYAVIGLIVCILAFAIVNFAISAVTDNQ